MSYAVVGGGVSGLATAYYLKQLPRVKSIVLLESSDRLGGWVQTTRHSDGVRHEHGPRTVRPAGLPGANTLLIAEDLGLQDAIVPIFRNHPAALNRLVLVDGQLHKLPSDFKSLFRRLPPFDRPLALAVWKDLMTPPKICEDESMFDFVSRRLGGDVAQYAIDPMARGICAGDSRKISAASFVAGPLFRMEQECGGITRGVMRQTLRGLFSAAESKSPSALVRRAREEQWSVWSLRNGLESFISALADNLRTDGVQIVTNARVGGIKCGRQHAEVTAAGGAKEWKAEHIFLTTPSFATAKMVAASSPELATLLESIPFVTVAVVTVEFEQRVTDDMEAAFGFLVPSNQPEPILGAIFDTCSFPQGDRDIFTVMMGGQWFHELFGARPEPATLGDCAVRELKKVLKIERDPCRVSVRIQQDCIAQYTVGHQSRVRKARLEIEEKRLPISLVGSSYDGVGINDSIMSARAAVERLVLQ